MLKPIDLRRNYIFTKTDRSNIFIFVFETKLISVNFTKGRAAKTASQFFSFKYITTDQIFSIIFDITFCKIKFVYTS